MKRGQVDKNQSFFGVRYGDYHGREVMMYTADNSREYCALRRDYRDPELGGKIYAAFRVGECTQNHLRDQNASYSDDVYLEHVSPMRFNLVIRQRHDFPNEASN